MAELQRLRVQYAKELVAGVRAHMATRRLDDCGGHVVDARVRFANRGRRAGQEEE